MRYGYWTPVYGGFLRNVDDEGMPASYDYIRTVTQTADRLGFDLTLIPELYLNDRKGIDAPSLEAWELAAALAAVTRQIEILIAVRPGFHLPAVAAKRVATLDDIAPGRIALNIVAAWWEEEAKQYGGRFTAHDERYAQASEFVDILRGTWGRTPFSYEGRYFSVEDTHLEPKPSRTPPIYAGGESEGGKEAIARFADSYVMHGGTVEEIAEKIADLNARKRRLGRADFTEFGMAAYVIVRDTEAEAQRELERITRVTEGSKSYASYQSFVAHSQLEHDISLRDYSVGTRGLRPDLVGTPEQVAEKIRAYEDAGLGLLLIQASPLDAELERLAADLLPLLRDSRDNSREDSHGRLLRL